MSLAANINAIALCELFLKNKRLRHLYVDIDFSLLDEKMVSKIQSLFYNVTIVERLGEQSFAECQHAEFPVDKI